MSELGGNKLTIDEFKRLLHNQKRAAWNAFPMRHYSGLMSVEVVDSTDDQEGGYLVWHALAGGTGEKSSELFYKFSDWDAFEMDILRKMHPQFICACANTNECFSEECPVKAS